MNNVVTVMLRTLKCFKSTFFGLVLHSHSQVNHLFEICKTVVVDHCLQTSAGGTKSSDLLIEMNLNYMKFNRLRPTQTGRSEIHFHKQNKYFKNWSFYVSLY